MRIIGFIIIVFIVIASYTAGQFSMLYKLTKCSKEQFISVFYNLLKLRGDIEIKDEGE